MVGVLIFGLGVWFDTEAAGQLLAPDGVVGSGKLTIVVVAMRILLLTSGLILYFSKGLARLLKIRGRELLISFAIFIAGLLVLELLTTAVVCSSSSAKIKRRVLGFGQCGLVSSAQPHHYLNARGTPGWVSDSGKNSHNAQGFRGPEIELPKPEGVYRVVTIGGSTTYSSAVGSWKDDFARQLQREFNQRGHSNVEVINAGYPGWNSWESLINLQINILDIQPDAIIIYHGTNDVHTRLVSVDAYKSDNSGRRRAWSEPDYPFVYRSKLVRLLTGINPLGGLGAYLSAPTAHVGLKETGFVETLGGTPQEILEQNKPIYFERNLRSMVAIAQAHDIDVLLSTWAYNTGFDDYAATPHYQYGYDEQNDLVLSLGDEINVPTFDFEPAMPDDKELWEDGRHLNKEGIAVKAKLFTEYVAEQTNFLR